MLSADDLTRIRATNDLAIVFPVEQWRKADIDRLLDHIAVIQSQLDGERAVWLETMDTHAFEKRKLTERAERAEAALTVLRARLSRQ